MHAATRRSDASLILKVTRLSVRMSSRRMHLKEDKLLTVFDRILIFNNFNVCRVLIYFIMATGS